MSDDSDSKTEEPTEKRLHDAIEGGNVPVSREIGVLLSLCAYLVIETLILPAHTGQVAATLMHFIDDPAGWRLNQAYDVVQVFADRRDDRRRDLDARRAADHGLRRRRLGHAEHAAHRDDANHARFFAAFDPARGLERIVRSARLDGICQEHAQDRGGRRHHRVVAGRPARLSALRDVRRRRRSARAACCRSAPRRPPPSPPWCS